MKTEKKLIAYSKVLNVYQKSTNILSTILGQNKYEKHITDWDIDSTFFVFGYDISKFGEIMNYNIRGKRVPRKLIIKVLKKCITEITTKHEKLDY